MPTQALSWEFGKSVPSSFLMEIFSVWSYSEEIVHRRFEAIIYLHFEEKFRINLSFHFLIFNLSTDTPADEFNGKNFFSLPQQLRIQNTVKHLRQIVLRKKSRA